MCWNLLRPQSTMRNFISFIFFIYSNEFGSKNCNHKLLKLMQKYIGEPLNAQCFFNDSHTMTESVSLSNSLCTHYLNQNKYSINAQYFMHWIHNFLFSLDAVNIFLTTCLFSYTKHQLNTIALL